jgi:hypothetical protein
MHNRQAYQAVPGALSLTVVSVLPVGSGRTVLVCLMCACSVGAPGVPVVPGVPVGSGVPCVPGGFA